MARVRVKFGGPECLLNSEIAMTLLSYDPSCFRKLLCLSPNWHYLVLEGMDLLFKPMEVAFTNMYYGHLLFKSSYTNSSVILSGGRPSIRVDRILKCEVLANRAHLDKCLRISYAYKVLANNGPLEEGPSQRRRRNKA